MKVSENQTLHLRHERRIMGSWMSRTMAKVVYGDAFASRPQFSGHGVRAALRENRIRMSNTLFG